MPAWYFPWSEAIKKRACRYLLQRYLGQFLQQKLTLDQLSVDLYSGKGIVRDVLLDVEHINDALDSANCAFEIVDGFIALISVEIPWSNLLLESTAVEIEGLEITLRPKHVADKGPLLDSMWGSMTMSSMQLAEELLKEEERAKRTVPDESDKKFEGMEKFAQAIDIVLTRIKVNVKNIVVRLEQTDSSSHGVALEVRIERIDFSDEAADNVSRDDEPTTYSPAAFANKRFRIQGVTLYSDDFNTGTRSLDRLSSVHSVTSSVVSRSGHNELFYSALDVTLENEPTEANSDLDIPTERPAVESAGPKLYNDNLVKIAHCHGVHEARLKVKQNPDVPGPKFELEGHFGIVNVLLWPKQLEMLKSLFEEVIEGTTQKLRTSSSEEIHKRMTQADYSKIEMQLQKDLDFRGKNATGGNSVLRSTWTSEPHSPDDEFFPVGTKPDGPEMLEDVPLTNQQGAKRQRYNMDGIVMNSAKLKIKSFFLTVVEENPVSAIKPSVFPFHELQETSQAYFEALSDIPLWDLQDTLQLRDRFARTLPGNHIWTFASGVMFEATEREFTENATLSIKCSGAAAEMWEHLFDHYEVSSTSLPDSIYRLKTTPLCTELLTFPSRTSDDRYSFTPCILLELEFVEPLQTKERRPKSLAGESHKKLNVTLQPFKTDFDLTIIDRVSCITDILTSTPKSRKLGHNAVWKAQTPSPASLEQSSFEMSFQCPQVGVNVRFPVLDLRPGNVAAKDLSKRLQKESLFIELMGFSMKSKLNSEAVKRIDFDCQSLNASIQMDPGSKPVPIARVVVDLDSGIEEGRREEFAERPRLSITMREFHPNIRRADSPIKQNDHELDHVLEDLVRSTEKEPSLFSEEKNIIEHEEITCVIPSDDSEAEVFRESVALNSNLALDIFLPCVNLFSLDRQVLEVLYNRINTDLLLWEPASKRTGGDYSPLSAAQFIGKPSRQTSRDLSSYAMCRSMTVDRDSDSEGSDSGNTEGHPSRRERVSSMRKNLSMIPSDTSVKFRVGRARVEAKIENPTTLNSQPLIFCGLLEVEDLNVFSVSGYHGQPEVKFSSISAASFTLDFGDFGDLDSLPRIVEPLPIDLRTSPLPVEKGKKRLMFNASIQINVDTFRHVKDIKVALEFDSVKLNHQMTTIERFWLTQLIDFVNLKDFPVMGYNAPTVITEFHLNLQSSLADYRPVKLDTKAAVTVEKMNISSTIVAESPQSLMRIITQDLRVHLSNHQDPRALKTDYVCVMDIPFMEFQMKLTDGTNPKFPRFDFRASNNCCYLRTCSDSFQALSELIVYLANDGDLESDSTDSSQFSVQSQPQKQESTKSDEELMKREMLDAMRESHPKRETLPQQGMSASRLPVRRKPKIPMAASITASVAGHVDHSSEEEVDYDDFCMVEEDVGVGIPLRNGEPNIKYRTQNPIRIIENYFSVPSALIDQLKAPDGYPVPVIRISLREMSIVWSLYGGNDFASTKVRLPRSLGSQNRLHSAPAKLSEAGSPGNKAGSRAESHRSATAWPKQGGPGRDHTALMEIFLNKVKFQHELYPYDGKSPHAARQVVLVQDFEIRDRMANSEINKFLYQYVSSNLPKQSHKPMLTVKAFHERPDPALPMQECTLKISLQPLRLNIDQESMFFLSDFFVDAADSLQDPDSPAGRAARSRNNSSSSIDATPVRTRRLNSVCEEEQLPTQDPLIQLEEQLSEEGSPRTVPTVPDTDENDYGRDSPIFFKEILFAPEVPIRLNYYGKYVDTERVGALGGLLIGLAQLDCSMLRLSRIHHRQGIRGIDRLVEFVLKEWLNDIRKTQLANLLSGVGPMHCLVQLVQGVRDLFWLPVEQYRKDGRIVRGVQRGATAFTTSTLIATIELANRIVQTFQFAAESAYDVISPGPSFRRKKKKKPMPSFPKAQPGDIREGIVTAYQVLTEGFTDTAREIVESVKEEKEHKGMTGAVGATLRQVGPAFVKPLILASQATSNVLGGIRNQLQPDFRQEEMEKWRTEDDVKEFSEHRQA